MIKVSLSDETRSSFESCLVNSLNKAFLSWKVLLIGDGIEAQSGSVQGACTSSPPRLVFIKSTIMFLHQGLGILESQPNVGPVCFHAQTLGCDWSKLHTADEMTVLAVFDEMRSTFVAELVIEHKMRPEKLDQSQQDENEGAATHRVAIDAITPIQDDMHCDAEVELVEKGPAVAQEHLKCSCEENCVQGKISYVANKFVLLTTTDGRCAFLEKQYAGHVFERFEVGDRVTAVARWNEQHCKWQASEVVAYTPGPQARHALTLVSEQFAGSMKSDEATESDEEIEGWTALDCLQAHLAMRGGKMPLWAISTLYESYPASLRSVRKCGGIEDFCAQNASAVRVTYDSSGAVLHQVGDTDLEASVLKCLFALIDYKGGSLATTQLGLLYQFHPAAKGIIKQSEGLKKFCSAHAGITFFEISTGFERLERSRAKGDLESDSVPQGETAVLQALLSLIDSNHGSLPVSQLNLLFSKHPEAMLQKQAAGSVTKFLALFKSKISILSDGDGGLKLQRPGSSLKKSTRTGTFTLGDHDLRRKHTLAVKNTPTHDETPVAATEGDSGSDVKSVQGCVNKINVHLGAFITNFGSRNTTFLSLEVLGDFVHNLEVGNHIVAKARWEYQHEKYQAVTLISVNGKPAACNTSTAAWTDSELEGTARLNFSEPEEPESVTCNCDGELTGSQTETDSQLELEGVDSECEKLASPLPPPSEIEGWTTLDCLLAHLTMNSGQMRASDMATVYTSYPAAAHVIRSCGGLQSFCNLHDSAVTMRGSVVHQLPSEWEANREASVLKCVLALIDSQGGSLTGAQLGLLYKLHPESKSIVKKAEGISKFCARFHRFVSMVIPEQGGFLLVKPT